MKKWTILTLLMMGCFSRSGQSSKPDSGELSTFEQFSRWGLGMAGFTANPSSGAGGRDTGSWGGDDGWGGDDDGWGGDDDGWGGDDDWDTGSWGSADGSGDDGSGSGVVGACYFEGECYEVPREACPESAGAAWYSGSCEEMAEAKASTETPEKLEETVGGTAATVGGVK